MQASFRPARFLFPLLLALAYSLTPAAAAVTIDGPKAAIKTEGGPGHDGAWNLWANGRIGQPLRFAAAGRYAVVVRAWGTPAGGVWPEMALLIDELPVKLVKVDRAVAADYAFEADIPAGLHEVAVAFLNDALIGNEDRNLFIQTLTIRPPAGSAEPQLARAEDLADLARQQEQDVLARLDESIDRNRKSDGSVRVVDATGQPLAGAKVRLEQVSHEFLFGCNIYMFDKFKEQARNEAYKARFAELFNYATVGFYWRWYEHEQGKPNYPQTDKVVAWCREHSIRMKGHPLLWGDPAGVPPWSKGQPAPELQRRRVEEILGRYRGQIEFWEVVNEPSHLREPKINEPYRWARAFNPKAYLIVNDYFVLGDGAPGFLSLLKAAIADGVPFDGIGIQAHEPRMMRFPLGRVQRILDQYAALGKELHITEFTPTSGGAAIIGPVLPGVWDEPAQADYAVRFYKLCFAHPAMRAITWWDLCDTGAFLKGGGMIRADMTPKPVYLALRKLIHEEWKTRAAGATGPGGTFAFRGFRGGYRVTVEAGPKTASKDFLLRKGDKAEWVVAIP